MNLSMKIMDTTGVVRMVRTYMVTQRDLILKNNNKGESL